MSIQISVLLKTIFLKKIGTNFVTKANFLSKNYTPIRKEIILGIFKCFKAFSFKKYSSLFQSVHHMNREI